MKYYINKKLEGTVRVQAKDRCEYCQLLEQDLGLPHVIDHIVSRQHGGGTIFDNLALACTRCNLSKGPNVGGIDPKTKRFVRLFHPRKDVWRSHFRWHGANLVGLTAIGRVTIYVLAINHPFRVALRRLLG